MLIFLFCKLRNIEVQIVNKIRNTIGWVIGKHIDYPLDFQPVFQIFFFFFSLDIEGAELQVIRTVPWAKVNIRALLIEVDHLGEIFSGSQKELNKFLKKSGYKFLQSSAIDDIYVKTDFKILLK